MAITTLQQIKDLLPSQTIPMVKSTILATVTETISSSWTAAGEPGAAANPSSGLAGDVPTSATVGAPLFTNAGGSDVLYIAQASWNCYRSGYLYLFDRLLQNSGISVTATTAQTLNTVALTRPDALGADVEAWWHVYAVMGAGAPTITLSYTNQAGTAGRTATAALSSAMGAGRTGPFQLQSGDTGVRSVQTWTNSVSFVTGTIGLVLRRRVSGFALPKEGETEYFDAIKLGLPIVYNNAALEMVHYNTSTSTTMIVGELNLIAG